MTRITFVAASLSLALIACRGGSSDDTPGDDQMGSDGSGSNAGDVSIQEVQNDAMASGTALELHGVVVTAIDIYGDRTGDMFVGEPEGGAFSGVKVYGTPLDTLATLQVGDIVDITSAEKHEACNQAAPCGSVVFDDEASITEVQGVSVGSLVVTKTGSGALPPASEVDAKAVAALAKDARVAEWEKWEGVRIKVTNARQLTAPAAFGGGTADDSKEFRITGVARVQSVLAAIPTTAVAGTCYDSVTGIGDFFFNNLILPSSEADFVGGGLGCLPLASSVAMVQSSTTIPELVSLTNVVVTARDDIPSTNNPAKSMGVWVADSLQGSANNGVYLFTDAKAIDQLVVGATVTVQGTVSEFDLGSGSTPAAGDTITEISPLAPIVAAQVTAPAGQPTAATSASVETLATIGAAGEPWEGVLVKISTVKVTNPDTNPGHRVELTDNNNKKIQMGKDAFAWGVQMSGACLDVTGVMSVAIFDDLRTINPRSAGDIVTSSGTCTGI